MTLPTPKGIDEALSIIRPHVPETPLFRSEPLSAALSADVWLKVETVSPIASFKLRGALVDVTRALGRGAISRVVTSSTGNHGQGVALAARLLGLGADIFLPRDANPLKAAMVDALGASIHRHGDDNNDAKTAAEGFARAHGHHFVDDGGSVNLMEGAGTVGIEIARALDAIDRVYIPLGDGALLGGSACAIKATDEAANAATRVIGVQAEGAPALATVSTRARRSNTRSTPSPTVSPAGSPAAAALAALWAFAADAILVSDDDLLAAIHSLAECAHILVEPAGAAALAGAWRARQELAGERVVLVLTGANLPMETLRLALAAPPLFPATPPRH